jgi:DNA-binding NtrC family response regulator
MSKENPNPDGPFKVVIVDDEPEFLEVLIKRLRKRNLAAIPAGGGEEALERLAQGPFDAVVLDMKMPGMGGMETLQEIKKASPSVEVIILTGLPELTIAAQAMELGAFDYLLKPPDIDELLYRIEDACRRKRHKEAQGCNGSVVTDL